MCSFTILQVDNLQPGSQYRFQDETVKDVYWTIQVSDKADVSGNYKIKLLVDMHQYLSLQHDESTGKEFLVQGESTISEPNNFDNIDSRFQWGVSRSEPTHSCCAFEDRRFKPDVSFSVSIQHTHIENTLL